VDRKAATVLLVCLSAVFLVGCLDSIAGGEGAGVDDSTGGEGEYEDWESEPPEIEPTGSAYLADGGNNTNDTVTGSGAAEVLRVHFVDVGQADFTLFEGPNANVVVDTADWQDENVVPYLREQGIDEIDLLVATHPDADHIGQLPSVMRQMEVEEVWMSGTVHTTRTYEEAVDAVLESDAGYYEPRAGEVFRVGNMKIEALHPEEGTLTGDTQRDSIAARMVYGKTSFMMTGDAEASAEREMVERAEAGEAKLGSDVYQMGHHGSSTSSTRPFLEAVSPDVAVYSAGEDNTFGHPTEEVIQRHADMGIEVYGTDTHGTVVVEADPEGNYTVETEKDAPPVVPFVTPVASEGFRGTPSSPVSAAVGSGARAVRVSVKVVCASVGGVSCAP